MDDYDYDYDWLEIKKVIAITITITPLKFVHDYDYDYFFKIFIYHANLCFFFEFTKKIRKQVLNSLNHRFNSFVETDLSLVSTLLDPRFGIASILDEESSSRIEVGPHWGP